MQKGSQNTDGKANEMEVGAGGDDSENILTIDVSEEIEDDINFLKDLAIICRFIGPKSDRKTIEKWIVETWKTPQITKFMPKGFFIVVFATEEERQKVLDGGLWIMNSKPLYIQKWCRNFNPTKTEPYEKPIWIRLNNLPMEYWSEEALEKIGRTLGTLMEVDAEIANGNSYLYAKIKLAAIRRVPQRIKLRGHGMEWIQKIEVEEEKYYCSRCGHRNHDSDKCKYNKTEKQVWRAKQVAGIGKIDAPPQLNYNEQVNANIGMKQKGEELMFEGKSTMGMEGKTGKHDPIEQNDIGWMDEGLFEEDEERDELDMIDIRNISQSVVIPKEKGTRGKGRKSNKTKREEEAMEKGLISVSEFLNRRCTKGVNRSLGMQ
ncbi:hypothetical protein SUGI_0575980 [Cryptomeria japonica]|nr:hypothetical protein SUGI_0575980 [Cryptomeria japonica]